MTREGLTYIAVGCLNAIFAFSLALWLQNGHSPGQAMLVSMAPWLAGEFLATLVLRRPVAWRAFCFLVTAPLGLFLTGGMPTIMRGDAPPWVAHSPYAVLLIVQLAGVCVVHMLAWRFLRPKGIAA